MKKINREQYLQDPFYVAKNLILGSYLYTNIEDELTVGKVTEVEVYVGETDKAAHSYLKKKTNRTRIQFGPGGYAYVFQVYGIHFQFCAVTNVEEVPNVVLVRSLEPTEGIDIMRRRRGVEPVKKLTVGPGNVCAALGINKEHYGVDLCGDLIYFCREESSKEQKIIETTRIGIDYAEEYAQKPWRYYLDENEFVSNKIKNRIV